MGIREYYQSQDIELKNYDFYAIIMAAMRQADTDNLFKLQEAFPEIWEELKARYHVPAGVLDKSEIKFAARHLKLKESDLANLPGEYQE